MDSPIEVKQKKLPAKDNPKKGVPLQGAAMILPNKRFTGPAFSGTNRDSLRLNMGM